jgi:hypothetical protein
MLFVIFLFICVCVFFYRGVVLFLINYHIYLVLFCGVALCVSVFRHFYINLSCMFVFFYSVFYWALCCEFVFFNLYCLYVLYDMFYIIYITLGVW